MTRKLRIISCLGALAAALSFSGRPEAAQSQP